jgi:hypothetical protein
VLPYVYSIVKIILIMRLFAQKHDLMKSAHTAPAYLRQPVDPVAEMMQAAGGKMVRRTDIRLRILNKCSNYDTFLRVELLTPAYRTCHKEDRKVREIKNVADRMASLIVGSDYPMKAVTRGEDFRAVP